MLKIQALKRGGRAWRAGIRPGDRLVSFGGTSVHDQFDLCFLSLEGRADLIVRRLDGSLHRATIPGEVLGELVADEMRPRRCGCRCVFCFVDQLPKGLRNTLYVKDEDYRYSYLHGSYVTLANLRACDLRRIIRYRLSPLYVSIHATDPAIRGRMLGLDRDAPVMPLLRELSRGRIDLHAQIVLCPGLNDGAVLRNTIDDLSASGLSVGSVAVVPVGLTGHRAHLTPIASWNAAGARSVLGAVAPLQRRFMKERGTPFVFLSDEWYLLARRQVPSDAFYGDYVQVENGVGILRRFIDDAHRLLGRPALADLSVLGPVTIVTGMRAADAVRDAAGELAVRTGADISVTAVRNALFGGGVTVAGLVGGHDIISSVSQSPPSMLVVPDVMLRAGGDMFLDDVSLRDLERATGARVVVVPPFMSALYRTLRRRAAYVRRRTARG